ncbi:hypothetical protein D3C73_940830 [compost metagenome]
MKIALAGICRSTINLDAEQGITLQRQIGRIAGLLQCAFLPVISYRRYTDTKTNIKAKRCAPSRLVVVLGLLLNPGEHILEGALFTLITVRVHIGDIIRNNIQPLL